MIGGKLGLPWKFDWKEGMNIAEEKGKGALVLLSVTSDFEEKKRVFCALFFLVWLFSVHSPP